VLDAAERIGFHATALIRHRVQAQNTPRRLGFVLQRRSTPFYQALGAALEAATLSCRAPCGTPAIEYLDDLTPMAVASALTRVGRRCEAVAVVAADHPHIGQAVEEMHAAGVPVFALLSDLTAPLRAGFIGLDSRQAGRTAAWAISRLSHAPGAVAIMLGSHRYLGHELCESGFRSYFREHAGAFRVLEAMVTLEEDRVGYEATASLVRGNPDLVGIYVAGGGQEGVIEALREAGNAKRDRHVVCVCNELTECSRAALIDGVIDLTITHPLARIATELVGAMVEALEHSARETPVRILLPFMLNTPENLE